MQYGSVCSGIEAATAAWHSLGWKPVFFSEIENFPRSVLKHHYPDVPLHGDFTTIGVNDYGAIDLLVGGTPCQSFSVAGLRGGIADDRGNLALEYIRLAERKKPQWLLWENVPGVFSSLSHDAPNPCEPPAPLDMECDGQEVDTTDEYDSEELHAFNCFLAGLSELGYGVAYRTLDAQYFGVPQRRRRVFVVGYFGDWRPAAAVLFERESLFGDITPKRQTGQDVAGTFTSRAKSGGWGTDVDLAAGNYLQVAKSLMARHGKCDPELETYVVDTLTCNGDAHSGFRDEKGLVAIPINTMVMGGRPSDDGRMGSGIGEDGDPAPTLSKNHSHAVAYGIQGNTIDRQPHNGGNGLGVSEEQSPTLTKTDVHGVMSDMQVRRLTPKECERLQGFPDDYTKVSDSTADGPRYKALGNSMAVPVMKWLGERITEINQQVRTKGLVGE